MGIRDTRVPLSLTGHLKSCKAPSPHESPPENPAARQTTQLENPIRCPSRPGVPTRTMSVRDQLISLAAHNAYHLGCIVLLRQLLQAFFAQVSP